MLTNWAKLSLSSSQPFLIIIIKAIKYGDPCILPTPSIDWKKFKKISFPVIEDAPEGIPITFDNDNLKGATLEHCYMVDDFDLDDLIYTPTEKNYYDYRPNGDYDLDDPIPPEYRTPTGINDFTLPKLVRNLGQSEFRVYSQGVMYYDGFFINIKDGKCWFIDNDSISDCGEEEPTIMRWIGVTVNGVKIYQGDIVEYDETDIGGEKGIGEVIWCDDLTLMHAPGYTLSNSDGISSHFPLGFLKVIGNIYENPEIGI